MVPKRPGLITVAVLLAAIIGLGGALTAGIVVSKSTTAPPSGRLEAFPSPSMTSPQATRLRLDRGPLRPAEDAAAEETLAPAVLAPAPRPTDSAAMAASTEPFTIDLYRPEDFVSQATDSWCVPAAIQTMVNIVAEGAPETAGEQGRLNALARRLSTPKLVGEGAEAEGWAGALEQLGYGPYVVRVEATREAAVRTAARALRLTRRPVGLMVWRGAHSWVMSGFHATADPALTDDFTVTHLRIQDPWYPRVSSIWGSSRPPDALVPVERMGEDFLPFRRPTVRYPDKDGRFVLVLPQAPD